MYKYLFGPVPSRRLGLSLGVDLVPKKVCSLDCVYCEVGKTTLLTSIRKEYISFEKVIEELIHYLGRNTKPDFITLTGSGEPTLNSRLGDFIAFIKQGYPEIPIAVLTNGTLFNNQDVRKELANADVVLPSLDAATDITFKKINCPLSNYTVKDHVEGLIKFRQCFTGKIWLEVFILPGYNNHEEIEKLRVIIEKIAPDAIQLNTLDRPGILKELYPATHKELKQIAKLLTSYNIEIIVSTPIPKNSTVDRKNLDSVILNTLLRRPCTIDDLIKITGLHQKDLINQLLILEKEKKIESILLKRGLFYRKSSA